MASISERALILHMYSFLYLNFAPIFLISDLNLFLFFLVVASLFVAILLAHEAQVLMLNLSFNII